MIAELTALSAVFSAYAEVVPGAPLPKLTPICILRVRGGSSELDHSVVNATAYSPRTRR